MHRTVILLFATCFLWLMGNHADARRAAPPEVVWERSANEKYEARIETREGKVTVYKVGDREKALWQLKLPEYGAFYSKVLVSDRGDYLLHVRGNHQVWELKDIGIQYLTNDGFIGTMPAGDFIDALVREPQATSIDPQSKWLGRVEALTDKSFTVINAKGEKKVVELKSITITPL